MVQLYKVRNDCFVDLAYEVDMSSFDEVCIFRNKLYFCVTVSNLRPCLPSNNYQFLELLVSF